ncbi:hypothetical protein [Streptomyces sp. NPDC006610]|uniref:hypothetical protein n=1 Tax=Streptomyces sp. NPDC006610 TaxID=3154584 RepID=UPI00339FA64E
MTDHRNEEPGRSEDPLPRDLPDQQTYEGDDPWDVNPQSIAREAGKKASPTDPSADVPDTDEGGTGRQPEPGDDEGPQESPA